MTIFYWRFSIIYTTPDHIFYIFVIRISPLRFSDLFVHDYRNAGQELIRY